VGRRYSAAVEPLSEIGRLDANTATYLDRRQLAAHDRSAHSRVAKPELVGDLHHAKQLRTY
jgi:hypothetical protein